MPRPRHDFQFDVAVIGGGPAGIATALSAAACGSSVILVEGRDKLGGNVAQAFVHTICGLFLPSAHNVPVHVHEGFPRVFSEAMLDRGDAGDVEWAGPAGFLPIDPAGFTSLAETLCDGMPRLERAMNTELVEIDDNRFRISAPNGFARDWLDNRYRPLISQTLARVVGGSSRLPSSLAASIRPRAVGACASYARSRSPGASTRTSPRILSSGSVKLRVRNPSMRQRWKAMPSHITCRTKPPIRSKHSRL